MTTTDGKNKGFWRSSWRWRRGFWVWLLLVAATLSLVSLYLPTILSTIEYSLSNNSDCLTMVIFCVVGATTLFCLVIFIRWLCCWRNFRRFLWGLACLVVLILMGYAEENWRGKHAWEKFKCEWEAKGERFDFASFIPPPVPDDQNFAFAPIVIGCYGKYLDKDGHRIKPPDTNVVNRLEINTHGHEEWHESFTNAPGSWQKATKINLHDWQQYYRAPVKTNCYEAATNEFPVAANPQTPAADVLLALSKYDSALEALHAAANQQPYSRFPLNYDSKLPNGIFLPHLYSLRGCAEVLQLRATTELELGQSGKALDDVKFMLRLADSIDTEPLLVSRLVRIGIVNFAIQPIWEGLAGHKWSDVQLVEIEKALGKLDFLSDCQFSMRSERASVIATIEYMRRNRSRALDCIPMITFLGRDDIFYPPSDIDSDAHGSLPFITILICHSFPRGCFYHNEITATRIYQQALLPTVDGRGQRIFTNVMHYTENVYEIERQHLSPYNAIALMLGSNLGAVSRRFVFAQSSLDMARVACALGRYRLAHGAYPETLDVLAPQFIGKLPHDIINGQPLHYRRTDDGQFVLYSVGWNEKDDGGVVGLRESGSVDMQTGDWVWRYPAK